MPVQRCTEGSRPGFRWGKSGKCYTYNPGSETSKNRAKKRAILQGVAIKGSGFKEDAILPDKPFITWLKALGLKEATIRSRLKRKSIRRPVPRTIERKYQKILHNLVARWRTLYLQTIDHQLESLAQEAYVFKPPQSVGVKTDAWPDKLGEIITQYEQQVTATIIPMENVTLNIGYDVSELNLKKWKKVVSGIVGISLFAQEPWLTDQLNSFNRQNIQLITKLAKETRVNIERIIEDGFQRGRGVNNIRKDILSNTKLKPGRFKKTRMRADLIAVDQVGKLNGQLSQLRQNEIGVDRYIWRTVFDERVRTSHKAMEGRLCRWDNATVYSDDGGKTWKFRSGIGGIEQHPGQDYRCRCFSEADFMSIGI